MLVDLCDHAVESVGGRGVDFLRLISGRKRSPWICVQDILDNRVDDATIVRDRGGYVCLRRNYGWRGEANGFTLPLISQQEKRLVLDDRSAQGSAKLIVVECVLRIRRSVEK